MSEKKAFTLIELLIVVAIIAILAAIAVPNFLEAQVRAKISRAHSDMRSLATAIEAYSVDNKSRYPLSCPVNGDITTNCRSDGFGQSGKGRTFPNCVTNINSGVVRDPSDVNSFACKHASFGIKNADNPGFRTLTTPTAYITSYPPDPFADTRGLVFGYVNAQNGAWILWSYGPDCDEKTGGQIGEAAGLTGVSGYQNSGQFPLDQADRASMGWEDMRPGGWWGNYNANSIYVYCPNVTNPSAYLITGGVTYDSTNRSKSQGDIYRVKQ
ncbi:TPA: hypothetical protein DDW35_13275 [Candidatus Sumerlaeota bacterium]|nr:hypothetical protein [Candidatus Sumerlaeota bacterium]